MTRIQKVVKDIADLQDFYKRTGTLRYLIKKKGLNRSNVEQRDETNSDTLDEAKRKQGPL